MGNTKYTPEIEDEIVASLKIGLTDTDAALASGISWDTFNRWQKRHARFADRVTRAKAERTRTWLALLRKNAETGDTRAIEALLDRCAPNYRKSTDMNLRHSGADSGPIQFIQVMPTEGPDEDAG